MGCDRGVLALSGAWSCASGIAALGKPGAGPAWSCERLLRTSTRTWEYELFTHQFAASNSAPE